MNTGKFVGVKLEKGKTEHFIENDSGNRKPRLKHESGRP